MKIRDLFEHRYLFVRHHLSISERKTLARITRGQPQLRSLRKARSQAETTATLHKARAACSVMAPVSLLQVSNRFVFFR